MNTGLIVGLVFGIPLFILGLFFCAGKFLLLIAGFHTSDQQKGYNAKKVGRAVGVFLLPISVLCVFMAASKNLTTTLLLAALVVILCVVLIVLVNTLKWFKE